MKRRVAVLGAGIMGSASALFLARRGIEVVLYDAASQPFSAASRWNEGKIHLGFLYAGDQSLRTAETVLPGGLAFRPLMEQLLDCKLQNITEADDAFLVHRDSVVSLERTRAYFESILDLARSHPAAKDYLVDLSDAGMRTLTSAEIGQIADSTVVVGGFAVPERSISTQWVADRFVDALTAERRIELRRSSRVLSVQVSSRNSHDSFLVRTQRGTEGPYDAVVNAAWEGRLGIDATLGLRPRHHWSHRYRVSLFVRTRHTVQAPSAVLCTGAFGDIKNYNGRDFYLSWYPSGLLASGEAIEPPPVSPLGASERDSIINQIFGHLGSLMPTVHGIQSEAEDIRLEGGWVFASGQGTLNDPASTLHQRDRIGIQTAGSYFSVDTGKYSVAPWLALQVAKAIAAD